MIYMKWHMAFLTGYKHEHTQIWLNHAWVRNSFSHYEELTAETISHMERNNRWHPYRVELSRVS
jgi:hypothetical protein